MRDAQDGALEVAHGAGGLHQGGRASVEALRAGGIDEGVALAPAQHRAREEHRPTAERDRQGLPGQCRLVDLERGVVQQPGVGGDDVAEAHPDHVPGHEITRRHPGPLAAAQRPGRAGEPLLERVDGVGRLVLLGERHPPVHHQQHGDDDGVRPVADQQREGQRGLDHPRDRRPEVPGENQQRVPPALLDVVGAEPGESLARLLRRQAVPIAPDLLLQGLQGHLGQLDRGGAGLPRRHGTPSSASSHRRLRHPPPSYSPHPTGSGRKGLPAHAHRGQGRATTPSSAVAASSGCRGTTRTVQPTGPGRTSSVPPSNR